MSDGGLEAATANDVGAFPLVLLAGGASTRMRHPKGLLPYRGATWLEAQLRRFGDAGGARAVVVLGFARDAYAAALPWVRGAGAGAAKIHGVDVRVAVNPEPAQGPFSSLVTGLRCILQSSDDALARAPGVFVLPVDTPCPRRATLERLVGAVARGAPAATPVFEGKGGHPVALATAAARGLAARRPEGPDARLDHALRAMDAWARVDVDFPLVARNANTRAAWEALVRELDAHEAHDAHDARDARDAAGAPDGKPTNTTDRR